MNYLYKLIFVLAATMPIGMLQSCKKETIYIQEPGQTSDSDDDPFNNDPNDSSDDDDYNGGGQGDDSGSDSDLSNIPDSDLKPSKYIYSYRVDNLDYKMIRVDVPSSSAFKAFYMMQCEMPTNEPVRFGNKWFGPLDKNHDGAVTKSEFQSFINAVREYTQLPFRLPTLNEWQFAAAGGLKSKHYDYAGGNNLDYLGWYYNNRGGTGAQPVMRKKPNELGFFDMSGNYAELCNDTDDIGYVDGPYCGGHHKAKAMKCQVNSWESGVVTGKIGNTSISEKDAFDASIICIRLMYPIVNKLEPAAADPGTGNFAKFKEIEYITTYTIGNNTYKMIRVDVPENYIFKTFYIMETELPINENVKFGDYWMAKIDSNDDKVIIKSDMQKYLPELQAKTNLPFRLPTIDEWQFAASGGMKSKHYKYAGGDSLDELGWYKTNSSGAIQGIKQKLPNELGLYDMSGNYAELCNNQTVDDVFNVDGPYCGGCFKDVASDCMITSWKPGVTGGNVPGTRYKEQNAVDSHYIGFRFVYTVDE